MKLNAWFSNMEKFLAFFVNIIPPEAHETSRDVRVAIFDGGTSQELKGSTLWPPIAEDESFCTEEDADGHFALTNPYYFSSGGHGTLMARLVRAVCPKAKLYVARLHQCHGTGAPQFTAESAAKVKFRSKFVECVLTDLCKLFDGL
jgi:hypothetical protein